MSLSSVDKPPGYRTVETRVGFYGCSRIVVRLATKEPRRRFDYPAKVRLRCPGCGHVHIARPHWRKWIEEIDAPKEWTFLEEIECPS